MAQLPGSLIPWVPQQFTDVNGDPLALGSVAFKVAGTNDDKDTYTDATLATPNQNPLPLDADGRPTGGSGSVFFETGGYDVFVYDENDVLVYSVEGVEDVGQTFLTTLGQTLGEGERDAPDDYQITEDDNTVTALPVAGGIYYLPDVTLRGLPLTFINKSTTIDAILTMFGAQTVNGVPGTFTVPAGTSPLFSGVTINPDPDAEDWLVASFWTT